jgi:hypothetical protein
MKISSKPSETTFSLQNQKKLKEVIDRVLKFKIEADSILSKFQPPISRDAASRLIEGVFKRFHTVALELNQRHEGRNSLMIEDEYDVQDLLRTLLFVFFDNIKPEEPTPSLAGSFTKMDLLLADQEIVIETKMTRNGISQKKIKEDIIIDKVHYKKHEHCKKLYCFVYDPSNKIRNPQGFQGELSDTVNGFETKVFVYPTR